MKAQHSVHQSLFPTLSYREYRTCIQICDISLNYNCLGELERSNLLTDNTKKSPESRLLIYDMSQLRLTYNSKHSQLALL